jgi:hypothetical protein
MANTADPEKEANPIAEIFDEVFTLMQDLETRSVAVFEYMQEQGGATDEKLAPYLDRAAGAADVRWRAARARMEHLLAPKPKSSTDVAKDDKAKSASPSQPQEKGRGANSGDTKSQGEKQQGAKPESKNLGKELASAPAATDKPAEQKDEKSEKAKPATEGEAKENEQGSKPSKEASPKSSDSASQAAALAGGQKSESQKDENAKSQSNRSENNTASNQSSGEEKQQSQKAAK